LKSIDFKFFIGEQVWYRRMNRIGEVIACSVHRDYGYYYTVRIAYQEKWQDVECDEEHLLSAAERLDQLLTRRATSGSNPDGCLSDTTDEHTGQ
jgi:hypothetical protein